MEKTEGELVISRFHDIVPYLKEFQQECVKLVQTHGYIATLHGRKLYNDVFYDDRGMEIAKEYLSISKLIQGSAADQMLEAISQCYENNIPLLMTVHDELDISVKTKEEALKLKEIMETCISTKIPMPVDITFGKNWGEASFDK
jgi:DNA polymerase I-like protein with 3'-5' exonuclease and polymerase domains